MRKKDIGRGILAAVILLLSLGPAGAGSHKTGSLEEKIGKILALRAKMTDKIDQAIEIRTRLEHRFVELREEIQAEQSRFEIHSIQQALQNMRIRYNLSLIQVIRAYRDRLNARIDYFQTGNERLRFMVYEINDSIAIINTLVDMEIENLMNRIDGLLNEYIPETKKQTFDAADILPVPVERVWNEIKLDFTKIHTMHASQFPTN